MTKFAEDDKIRLRPCCGPGGVWEGEEALHVDGAGWGKPGKTLYVAPGHTAQPEGTHGGPSAEDRAIIWRICCDEGVYHLVNADRSRSIMAWDDDLFELVEKAKA